MSLILGLDCGFTATGLALIDPAAATVVAWDCIRTAPSPRKRGVRVADDDAERCAALAAALWDAISVWRPRGAVVELPTGGSQGARALRAMGMATGVVVAILTATDTPAEWVTPQAVKLIAGRKDASKEAVEAVALRRLTWAKEPPKVKAVREHVADAAGAVLAAWDGMLARLVRGGVGA